MTLEFAGDLRKVSIDLVALSSHGSDLSISDLRSLPHARQGCLVVTPPGFPDESFAIIRNILANRQALLQPAPGRMLSLSYLKRQQQQTWTNYPVRSLAARLDFATLPASFGMRESLVLANDLRRAAENRPAIALGIWATHARSLQRLGAKLGSPDQSLTVEIASALRPTTVILLFRIDGIDLAVKTTDQVAAELVGLALHQHRMNEVDRVTPWQDPLIQRSIELELGINQPDQMVVRITAQDRLETSVLQQLLRIREAIELRLGLASTPG